MGLFDKLKKGLTKTWKSMNTDVRDLFKAEGRLVDQAFLDEMRAILFKTDMGYDAVEKIVEEVATELSRPASSRSSRCSTPGRRSS